MRAFVLLWYFILLSLEWDIFMIVWTLMSTGRGGLIDSYVHVSASMTIRVVSLRCSGSRYWAASSPW